MVPGSAVWQTGGPTFLFAGLTVEVVRRDADLEQARIPVTDSRQDTRHRRRGVCVGAIGGEANRKVNGRRLAEGSQMSSPRRTIALTEDNFCDFLATDYAESLVGDFAIGPGGVSPKDPIVDRFLAWLAWESSWSPDV